MRTIDAVIFDLDGVIIESEGAWDAVRRDLAAAHGAPWPPDAHARMMGMSTREWTAYMRDAVGVPLPAEAIERAVVQRLLAGYRRRLPLIPGAPQAVRRLARRRPLGVASSSPQALIAGVLELAGMADAFEVVLSSERVDRGKPAPDVYLEAARRLGVAPSRAAAVEDSDAGIRAALAAGMRVVAIPSAGYPPRAETLERADAVLPSIAWLWSAGAGLR